MRKILIPILLALLSSPGSSVAASSTEEGEPAPHYLKYGEVHTFHQPFYHAGGAGGGSWTGGGTSITAHFARCYAVNGTEACNPSQWIGFIGENLRAAVKSVPEADSVAASIQTTTLIQVASLVAVPVCLFSAISMANGPKDEYGRVQTHVGPGAVTLFTLTGVAFLNYVGWNIYERSLARKAIRIYNAKVDVQATLDRRRKGMELALRF